MYSFVFSQASSSESKSTITVYQSLENHKSRRYLLSVIVDIRPTRCPFLVSIHLSPSGCVRSFNSYPSTISFLMISIDFVYYKKMGSRLLNQNRVRCLKPRQSHGTTSNFQRNLHPAAIPFIIISLPFQTPSTVCRSPSQEPRYRKKVLLSKACRSLCVIRRTVEYSTSGIL